VKQMMMTMMLMVDIHDDERECRYFSFVGIGLHLWVKVA